MIFIEHVFEIETFELSMVDIYLLLLDSSVICAFQSF